MTFNSPLSGARVDRLIDSLALPDRARALDIGCGTGVMLSRVVERWGAQGVGIDPDARSITAARSRAPGIDWRVEEIHAGSVEDASLDLAICVGATHAFEMGEGATAAAMAQCWRWLKPGGQLLLGDGLWTATPDPAYLAFLGEHPGCYRDHAGNVALGIDHGFVPLHAVVSTLAEWDDFEWGHIRRGEIAGGARRERVRAWRDAYLRWGRGVMGFGAYVFGKPSSEPPISP